MTRGPIKRQDLKFGLIFLKNDLKEKEKLNIAALYCKVDIHIVTRQQNLKKILPLAFYITY